MFSRAKLWTLVHNLLLNPSSFWYLAFLVILGDFLLTQLIIRFVPYTEIDWETYMFHIELYLNGERNYSIIDGPTGHLVYPAGHVYIHRLLYAITDSGKNISLAQQVYGALYVLSLIITCAIYKRAKVPNWIIFLLPLSKRLHSIYCLRLFNDCWAAVIVQAAIYAYGRGFDDFATLLYTVALSVKMSNLLYLPGILVVVFKRKGAFTTVRLVAMILLVQVLLGSPFLLEYPKQYIAGAFDLSRVFLYKWTVNWRFISEDTFLRPGWAMSLLVGHVCTLTAFGLLRWCRRDGGVFRVLKGGVQRPFAPAAFSIMTFDYVITVLFTSNLIGVLFARSLHYQFYSWYSQQLPLIAWRTRYPLPVKLVLLSIIEYAWNVFPSTPLSSSVLCAANTLLVVGVFFGHSEGIDKGDDQKKR